MSRKTNRPAEPGPGDDLMSRVAAEIEGRGLTARDAAAQIGVGAATLEKHLAGEHVRSDSGLKYRRWLEGKGVPRNVFVLSRRETLVIDEEPELVPPAPVSPRRIVDIFSGCGGLSLGFDLLGEGAHFRTVLAADNQAAPIGVLNENLGRLWSPGRAVGRRVDLTEFSNETEFLAFYLEHTAGVERDEVTSRRLDQLAGGAFPEFRRAVAAVDAAFLADLNTVRSSAEWRAAWSKLDKQALGQTSVIGFHDQLKLPRTGAGPASLPPVLWAGDGEGPAQHVAAPAAILMDQATREWEEAEAALAARREATGRGQLTASARRVSAFVAILQSWAMQGIRNAWILWRARRMEVRADIFENPIFASQLRELYSERHPVAVLVGGPPCQGFSRIGRGKIRSLREALVHVHGDEQAGDARNLLFRQYVMVLEALRPPVFLFENVQHFQSTVRAGSTEFQATEVLAEAIENMSDGEVRYEVHSTTIDASEHGVPQTRQRYFMCGVRADAAGAGQKAAFCLTLPRRREVTLAEALGGLGEPDFVGGDGQERGGTPGRMDVTAAGAGRFNDWVRRAPGAVDRAQDLVDSHVARSARADDAALFALMGPGRRWMDYRVDDAPTVLALQQVLDAICALPDASRDRLRNAATAAGAQLPDDELLSSLRRAMNGSLALRLMLEQIGERLGAPHHLLMETYLAKRDGHHGDWVARMDPARPAKTMVSHMGKDTYGYVHPASPRTISVREAARVQTFPDWFSFEGAALTDAFRMVGNAVPPLLSYAIACRVAVALNERDMAGQAETPEPSRAVG